MTKMNRRGQALVEFVIILPIFVFMILAIIDIGKIVFFRNELENEMSDVVDLYRNQKSFQEIEKDLELLEEDIQLEIQNNDNQTITFFLKKDVEILTPGLNLILDSPFPLEVKRVIAYE